MRLIIISKTTGFDWLPGMVLTTLSLYLFKNDVITLAIYKSLFRWYKVILKITFAFNFFSLPNCYFMTFSFQIRKQSKPGYLWDHDAIVWAALLFSWFSTLSKNDFRRSAYSIIEKVSSYLSFWSWQVDWLPGNLSAIQNQRIVFSGCNNNIYSLQTSFRKNTKKNNKKYKIHALLIQFILIFPVSVYI